MDNSCGDLSFTSITPATTLEEVWEVFDPTLAVNPRSEFYVPRTDPKLQKLNFDLKQSRADLDLHAFLCGHRGSGKTTELNRLCLDEGIQNRYFTIYLTAQDFGSEVVHLTHDALLVEIGLAMVKKGVQCGMPEAMAEELHKWGREVVKSYIQDESLKAEAGAKGSAWLAYFKAQ